LTAPTRWNANGTQLQAELATEATYLSRAQEAGEERLRELQREHELLTQERDALDRETDDDVAERNVTEMRLRENLRLHRLLRDRENRPAESSSRNRLRTTGSSRSYRSPTFRREATLSGLERSPYMPYENARYTPARPTVIENDYGHPVDPSESTSDWLSRSMAPLREQSLDRADAPAPPPASRSLRVPAYTTWDYTHLREGIESSGTLLGAVRATEATASGPEMLIVAEFPPLRRMSGRSIDAPASGAGTPAASRRTRPFSGLREVWSPTSPVDGLGDRARSFSPDDSWDTMLTTIAPDATLPSADSSFTSAAASASFSAGRSTSADSSSRSTPPSATHSASSSQTHLTVPSRSDDWTCETDEELEDLESGVRNRTGSRNPVLRRSPSGESTPYWRGPSTRPYEWRATSAEISRQDVPTATSLGNTLMSGAGETPTDPDLEQLEGILERLARRDDIPDELWISAGLNPSLARNLDLFARREASADASGRREDRERL
jgi:hypothetical protein